MRASTKYSETKVRNKEREYFREPAINNGKEEDCVEDWEVLFMNKSEDCIFEEFKGANQDYFMEPEVNKLDEVEEARMNDSEKLFKNESENCALEEAPKEASRKECRELFMNQPESKDLESANESFSDKFVI